jgi:hypothetical protein
MSSDARSPITTHGAIVLSVVIRGKIDASAIRSPSILWTRKSAPTTDISSYPIFAVPTSCQ